MYVNVQNLFATAHVGAIDPALLELASAVVPRLPNLRAIIFEAVPQSVAVLGADGLRRVLASLHALAELPPVPAVAAVPRRDAAPMTGSTTQRRRTADREAELLAYTTRATNDLDVRDPGADLIRALTDEGRLSLLVADHADELGRMLARWGPDGTHERLRDFLTSSPASAWPEEQGRAFEQWLAQVDLAARRP